MQRTPVAFSDDISEYEHRENQYDDNDDESSTSRSEDRPITAPQVSRTPVFLYKNEEKKAAAAKPLNPSRPATSNNRPQQPPSSSSSVHRPNSNRKNNVNLENRILIKMATHLPSQEAAEERAAHGRLPESRNTLLKLNAELDDMAKDIRELNTDHGHYLMMNFLDVKDPNEIPAINLETGQMLYDVVIAELTNQAFKKVMRINKFYRHHLVLGRNKHQHEVKQLQLEIDQLRSQLHQQQLANLLPSAILTASDHPSPDPTTTVTANNNSTNSTTLPFLQLSSLDHSKSSLSPPGTATGDGRRTISPPPQSSTSPARLSGRNSGLSSPRDTRRKPIHSPSPGAAPGQHNTLLSSAEEIRRQNANFDGNFEEFMRDHTSYALGETSKKLELLHTYTVKTLDNERKVRGVSQIVVSSLQFLFFSFFSCGYLAIAAETKSAH
jgi:hypothetical protein